MGMFHRTAKNDEAKKQEVETPVITIDSIHRGLDYLVELVKQIRPARYADGQEAELKFKALFYQLLHDKKVLFSLRKALLSQFLNSNFITALTESGLVSSRGFLQELMTKIKHRLLPPLLRPDDFLYVINHVFYKKNDHVWVEKIDKELWINFFKVLGIQVSVTNKNILAQLNQSLHILSNRTVTLGLEKEVMKSLDNVNYQEYSFFLLDREVENYLRLYEKGAGQPVIVDAVKKITDAIQACKQTIEHISEERRTKGTSLSQTYTLFRIDQHLERLLIITDVLDSDNHFNPDRFLNYFTKIIAFEKEKNSLREFISANFAFLAFKITEHGGTRGEKYITATRREYWFMIRSAMGGGFIVSFTAIIKNLISKLGLLPFWQGFAYSVNYAVGFQMMHETNTTLATKQPAFTASAIASSLDYFKEYRKPDMYAIAITIARTSRSQIASFFGNLIIVFPLSWLLASAYFHITGHLLLDSNKAHHTLVEQHPWQSFSLIYACFTGFFLFVSGLIAGYVENGINYGRVRERLKNHPVFRNTLSPRRLEKVTRYVENDFGALAGNIALGFFLGMAGFFGNIFGIPFDIRHITIASGNTAIAYYTQGNAEPTSFMIEVLCGVLLIGLFNFLVSFALAFFVAVKSRGVRLRDYPELMTVVGRFFIKFPFDFFIPPKYPREIADVKRKFRLRMK
ncbi:MAG: site-specific recombinase Gcr [Segetibacter sp.]|nr:site-specific recombinase Gcr [Segetibacter sp.]